jgi:hypothetical protein
MGGGVMSDLSIIMDESIEDERPFFLVLNEIASLLKTPERIEGGNGLVFNAFGEREDDYSKGIYRTWQTYQRLTKTKEYRQEHVVDFLVELLVGDLAEPDRKEVVLVGHPRSRGEIAELVRRCAERLKATVISDRQIINSISSDRDYSDTVFFVPKIDRFDGIGEETEGRDLAGGRNVHWIVSVETGNPLQASQILRKGQPFETEFMTVENLLEARFNRYLVLPEPDPEPMANPLDWDLERDCQESLLLDRHLQKLVRDHQGDRKEMCHRIVTLLKSDLEELIRQVNEFDCQLCGEPLLEKGRELVRMDCCGDLLHQDCLREGEFDTCPLCGEAVKTLDDFVFIYV